MVKTSHLSISSSFFNEVARTAWGRRRGDGVEVTGVGTVVRPLWPVWDSRNGHQPQSSRPRSIICVTKGVKT